MITASVEREFPRKTGLDKLRYLELGWGSLLALQLLVTFPYLPELREIVIRQDATWSRGNRIFEIPPYTMPEEFMTHVYLPSLESLVICANIVVANLIQILRQSPSIRSLVYPYWRKNRSHAAQFFVSMGKDESHGPFYPLCPKLTTFHLDVWEIEKIQPQSFVECARKRLEMSRRGVCAELKTMS